MYQNLSRLSNLSPQQASNSHRSLTRFLAMAATSPTREVSFNVSLQRVKKPLNHRLFASHSKTVAFGLLIPMNFSQDSRKKSIQFLVSKSSMATPLRHRRHQAYLIHYHKCLVQSSGVLSRSPTIFKPKERSPLTTNARFTEFLPEASQTRI